ncbi:putative death-receptor fusion protein-domain-containing protein [Haematococcus lacustris]
MVAPGQGLDHIIRRSAGLPVAVDCLLRAEPGMGAKVLLPMVMTQLLAVAAGGGPALVQHSLAAARPKCRLTPPQASAGSSWPAAQDQIEAAVGIGATGPGGPRAAGADGAVAAVSEPWPSVHAFNCLRTLFQDAQLAVDVSGYCAPGIQACVDALGSCSWEVRNAATLCFTALVVRMLGFRNAGQWEASKRSITGAEFFQRFPGLHAYLLQQFRTAVDVLEEDTPRTPAAAAALPKVHPSLYPVLVLLSRLRPGPPRQAILSPLLSPAAFAPLVRRCAAARLYAVRQLAAAALSPLVPSEAVVAELSVLLDSLESLTSGSSRGACPASTANSTIITAGERVRLGVNATQGILMQITALLQHNVYPGLVAEVLQLVGPCLVAISPRCLAAMAGNTQAAESASRLHAAPAALGTAWFRAASAGLELLHPHHLAPTHPAAAAARQLLDCADAHCAAVVLASLSPTFATHPLTALTLPVDSSTTPTAAAPASDPGLTGPVTRVTFPAESDWQNPMASVMRKEAARLWLGPALSARICCWGSSTPGSSGQRACSDLQGCSAAGVTPSQLPDLGSQGAEGADSTGPARWSTGQVGGQGAVAGLPQQLLLSRLGQSLQSPDYDIRAAAAKALAVLVEQALAGLPLPPGNHSSHQPTTAPLGRVACEVSARAAATAARWHCVLPLLSLLAAARSGQQASEQQDQQDHQPTLQLMLASAPTAFTTPASLDTQASTQHQQPDHGRSGGQGQGQGQEGGLGQQQQAGEGGFPLVPWLQQQVWEGLLREQAPKVRRRLLRACLALLDLAAALRTAPGQEQQGQQGQLRQQQQQQQGSRGSRGSSSACHQGHQGRLLAYWTQRLRCCCGRGAAWRSGGWACAAWGACWGQHPSPTPSHPAPPKAAKQGRTGRAWAPPCTQPCCPSSSRSSNARSQASQTPFDTQLLMRWRLRAYCSTRCDLRHPTHAMRYWSHAGSWP